MNAELGAMLLRLRVMGVRSGAMRPHSPPMRGTSLTHQ
jgi:hypothetical protein